MHYFLKERATKRLYAWWSLAIIDSVADLLPSLFSEKNGNKKVHRSTCCKRNRTIQMCFSSLSLRGKMKFVSAILLPIPHPLLVFSKSSDQQLIFNDILHYNFTSCNITNREKKNLLSIHHTSKETNICLKKKKIESVSKRTGSESQKDRTLSETPLGTPPPQETLQPPKPITFLNGIKVFPLHARIPSTVSPRSEDDCDEA